MRAANAQADLSLHRSNMSEGTFSHAEHNIVGHPIKTHSRSGCRSTPFTIPLQSTLLGTDLTLSLFILPWDMN